MSSLLHIAVSNAVLAIPLAVIAFALSRWTNWPALKHTLWILVLAKLVTPPLVTLPLVPVDSSPAAWTWSTGSSTTAASTARVDGPGSKPTTDAVRTGPKPRSPGVAHAASPHPGHDVSDGAMVADTNSAITEAQPAVTSSASLVGRVWGWLTAPLLLLTTLWFNSPQVQLAAMWLWLAGTLGWLLVQLLRAIRFGRMIARCHEAPVELQQQTAALGERLGLTTVPRVVLVEAPVSPMLWGCGRGAHLLFPRQLAERLDDAARDTLLMHELAHFSRGDHCVRMLEVVVTTLFWWHPVVWVARQQIEQAEEECCDAWVVQKLPYAPRRYAQAILDTIDFLCEARRSLPPLASGLGQAPFLRRRLTQIMQGTTVAPLSRPWRAGLMVAAVVLLPLQPFVLRASVSPAPATADARQLSADVSAPPSSINSSNAAITKAIRDAAQARRQPSRDQADSQQTANANRPPDGTRLPSRTPLPATGPRVRRHERIWSTAVSPDGRFVIRATLDRKLTLVDLREQIERDLSAAGVIAVAFAPHASTFVTSSPQGLICEWSAETGELQHSTSAAGERLRALTYTADGEAILAGGDDGTLVRVALGSSMTIETVHQFDEPISSIRVSPSGRQVAVAVGDWKSSSGSQVQLLDSQTWTVTGGLPCASAPGAMAYVSENELIIGLWDGHAELWRLEPRELVAYAQVDKHAVAAASFSPNNPALREMSFVAPLPLGLDDLAWPLAGPTVFSGGSQTSALQAPETAGEQTGFAAGKLGPAIEPLRFPIDPQPAVEIGSHWGPATMIFPTTPPIGPSAFGPPTDSDSAPLLELPPGDVQFGQSSREDVQVAPKNLWPSWRMPIEGGLFRWNAWLSEEAAPATEPMVSPTAAAPRTNSSPDSLPIFPQR